MIISNKFRLAQKNFGKSPWLYVDFADDVTLAAQGYKLAGPGRCTRSLTTDEATRLRALLSVSSSALTVTEVADRDRLLSLCPFTDFVPPLDIDVKHDHAGYDSVTTPLEILSCAEKLMKELGQLGFGVKWAKTNSYGGLHGDITLPNNAPTPSLMLLRAMGEIVRTAAQTAGIPTLTGLQSSGKWSIASRPFCFVLDDTLFNRDSSSLGVMWRLVGAKKTPQGFAKQYITPEMSCPADTEDSSVNFALFLGISNAGSYTPPPSKKSEFPMKQASSYIDITENLPLQNTVAAFSYAQETPKTPVFEGTLTKERIDAILAGSSEIAEIWNSPLASIEHDRSKRLMEFVTAMVRFGLSEDEMVAMAYAMPGSKAAQDNRNRRYITRQIDASRQFLKSKGERAALSDTERARCVDYRTKTFASINKTRSALHEHFLTIIAQDSAHSRFKRIAICGKYSAVESCSVSNTALSSCRIVCEDAHCLMCGGSRAAVRVSSLYPLAPETCSVGLIPLRSSESSPEACAAIIDKLRSEMPTALFRAIRTVVGIPGVLLIADASLIREIKKYVTSPVHVKNRDEVCDLILNQLRSRSELLRSYLVKIEAEVGSDYPTKETVADHFEKVVSSAAYKEMLADRWFSDRITTTRAGKTCSIPWITDRVIRTRAVERARARKQAFLKAGTPHNDNGHCSCHGSAVRYATLSQTTGESVGVFSRPKIRDLTRFSHVKSEQAIPTSKQSFARL